MPYDALSSVTWMRHHRLIFLIISFLYVFIVIKLPQWLKGRKGLNLRTIIMYWNAGNAFIDIFLLFAISPDFLTSFSQGLYSSVCLNEQLYTGTVSGRAMFMFHLSKCWQLLDSVLIALEGHPLPTLHVAHHVTTMVTSVYGYYKIGAIGRWLAMTNLISQLVLYSYLMAQSIKRKQRRESARMVTIIQIIQFPICILLMFKAKGYMWAGKRCDSGCVALLITLYSFFLLLFIQYYGQKFHQRGVLCEQRRRIRKG